jgi:hypothetical protein
MFVESAYLSPKTLQKVIKKAQLLAGIIDTLALFCLVPINLTEKLQLLLSSTSVDLNNHNDMSDTTQVC